MTIVQAKSQVRKVQADLKREAQGAVSRSLTKGKNEARRMSSGPLSLAELRRRDHPYARRHGGGLWSVMPKRTPAVINVQTGAFRDAWATDRPRADDRTVTGRLSNQDRVADWLRLGTRRMVARPVDVWLEQFLYKTLYDEVSEAARRIHRYYS